MNNNLVPTYSRRTFWRGLLHEAFVVSGLLKGGQAYNLSDLGALPAEALAQVRPIVHPACEIFVDGDLVCGRWRETGAVTRLFPVEETARAAALGMFDGQHTLEQVGARLAQAMNWEEEQGWVCARDLFVSLAQRLICVPRNPLEIEE